MYNACIGHSHSVTHDSTNDTHGCNHAFTTGYTTVDAMLEIGTTSATLLTYL